MSETQQALLAGRPDFAAIARWVSQGARVLDLGCGDGALLKYLWQAREAPGYGVEIDDAEVVACVRNDINVLQLDLESGLSLFRDGSFDTVILSETLQTIHRIEQLLREMLRVGREAIVSFPNFGHWQVRGRLLLTGRMPVTEHLPDAWYVSPNAHLCTIKDFADLVDLIDASVEEAVAFNTSGQRLPIRRSISLQNLLGEKAVFLLRKRTSKKR